MESCPTCGTPLYPHTAEPIPTPQVLSPATAYELVKGTLAHARQEKLVAIYLDTQNRPIGKPLVVSVGTLNTNRTQPREILRPAIKRGALGIVIAHNHPSGSLTPSDDDIAFTKMIVKAAATVGFQVFDHLVVSKAGFTSIREHGAI